MRENATTVGLAIDQRMTHDQRRHVVVKLQRLIGRVHDLRRDSFQSAIRHQLLALQRSVISLREKGKLPPLL